LAARPFDRADRGFSKEIVPVCNVDPPAYTELSTQEANAITGPSTMADHEARKHEKNKVYTTLVLTLVAKISNTTVRSIRRIPRLEATV
jgi:hypothetical protein